MDQSLTSFWRKRRSQSELPIILTRTKVLSVFPSVPSRSLELRLAGTPSSEEMFLASGKGFLNLSKRFRLRIVLPATSCHLFWHVSTCCEYLHKALYIFPSIWSMLQSEASSFSSPCGTFAFEIIKRLFHVLSKGGNPVILLTGGPSGRRGIITSNCACKHSVSTMR